MKVGAVVFGVMQAVTVNCESVLPGLMHFKKIFLYMELLAFLSPHESGLCTYHHELVDCVWLWYRFLHKNLPTKLSSYGPVLDNRLIRNSFELESNYLNSNRSGITRTVHLVANHTFTYLFKLEFCSALKSDVPNFQF